MRAFEREDKGSSSIGAILHSLRVKPVVGFRVGRTSPVVGIIAAHRYFPRLACSYREHFYRDSPDFLPVSRFDRRLSERNAPLSAYRCRYSFPSPTPSACLSVSLIPKRQRSTPTRLPVFESGRNHSFGDVAFDARSGLTTISDTAATCPRSSARSCMCACASDCAGGLWSRASEGARNGMRVAIYARCGERGGSSRGTAIEHRRDSGCCRPPQPSLSRLPGEAAP